MFDDWSNSIVQTVDSCRAQMTRRISMKTGPYIYVSLGTAPPPAPVAFWIYFVSEVKLDNSI
jgi:hypothetical protein